MNSCINCRWVTVTARAGVMNKDLLCAHPKYPGDPYDQRAAGKPCGPHGDLFNKPYSEGTTP